MRAFGLDPRSVNAQKFDRLRVPSFSLVDGDEVEDSVVSDAVYGESETDGHEGRIDLGVRSRVDGIRRVDQNIRFPRAGVPMMSIPGPWICKLWPKWRRLSEKQKYNVIDSYGKGRGYRYYIFFVR